MTVLVTSFPTICQYFWKKKGAHEGTKALRAKVPKWNRINKDHMHSNGIEKN